MKKVLLIDTSKKSGNSAFVPLALLKLSTKHKQKGDKVTFVKAGDIPRGGADIIYFSTIFLFDSKKDVGFIRAYAKRFPKAKVVVGGIAVTMMLKYYKKNINLPNVSYVTGLVPELDAYKPDYDIAKREFSYGFTSRGCPNKCPWCVVPKVEGKTYLIPEWKNAIDLRFKFFKGMDNNILSCPIEHIEEVFSYLHENNIRVDFNQAMDCQLLIKRKEVQDIFIKYPNIWSHIRFAWDSKRCNKYAMATLDFFQKHNIKQKGGQFMWYILYDFDEPPELIYDRVKKLFSHERRTDIKLMRYKDLDTGGLLRKWGADGEIWASWESMNINSIIGTGTVNNWVTEGDYNLFKERVGRLMQIKKELGYDGVARFRERLLKNDI